MNVFDKDREQLLFELIERHNSITLNRQYAQLENFINGTGVNGVDATVDVTSKDPTFYYNLKRVNYGKLNLNDQLKLQKLAVRMTSTDTSYTLLPLINAKFGLKLTTDDVQLTQVDTTSNPIQITIKATVGSWIYKTNDSGLVFVNDTANNQLSVPLKTLRLTGLVPPSTDLARIQGPLMTYPTFAADNTVIANYAVGYTMQVPTANDWTVADLFSTETGEVWSFAQTGFTLYGFKVEFNGLTSLAKAQGYHVNTDHPRALILRAGQYGKVGGYVTVHY